MHVKNGAYEQPYTTLFMTTLLCADPPMLRAKSDWKEKNKLIKKKKRREENAYWK